LAKETNVGSVIRGATLFIRYKILVAKSDNWNWLAFSASTGRMLGMKILCSYFVGLAFAATLFLSGCADQGIQSSSSQTNAAVAPTPRPMQQFRPVSSGMRY
jgi:hypothetical protein